MGLLNDKDLDRYLSLIGAYFAMKLGDDSNDEQTKEIYKRFDAVREHLYTLMKNNGWVSVNDRLPRVLDQVLLYTCLPIAICASTTITYTIAAVNATGTRR